MKMELGKKTLWRLEYAILANRHNGNVVIYAGEVVEVLEINTKTFEGDPYASTMEFVLMTSVGIVRTDYVLPKYANQL